MKGSPRLLPTKHSEDLGDPLPVQGPPSAPGRNEESLPQALRRTLRENMLLRWKQLQGGLSPTRLSVLGFLVLILGGAVLLRLPFSSQGAPLSWLDALFTSTSATCVTGLAVADTGRQLSSFGQLVLLGLIQIGGLGIMTISTLVVIVTGRRPSLRGRQVVQDSFGANGSPNLSSLLLDVFRFTFLIEGIGIVLLFLLFWRDHNASRAMYLAIFHAISAFCNAGFALFSNSLESYRADPAINGVISFLIIAGGLGFLVLAEVRSHLSWRHPTQKRWSLHTRLVLVATAALLFVGTALFLLLEWNNTLKGLPLGERLLAAFFQSVTSRTAGFNTLPIGQMTEASLAVMMLLMFVGAGSGSCAGGIKVGTFSALLLLALSRLRGQSRPTIFRRTLTQESMSKASSVVLLGTLAVLLAGMLLLITEGGGAGHLQSKGLSLEIFFEAVSAIGTAGISTGITSQLSAPGKWIIIALMFIGRLGPLAIALAVSRNKEEHYHYAEEPIMIG